MDSSGQKIDPCDTKKTYDSDDTKSNSAPPEDSSVSFAASSVIRFSGPARRQDWSFPDTIIFYVTMNPSSPKLYDKIIRTCKYFFIKNPITICSQLTYNNPEDYYDYVAAASAEGDDVGKDTWKIKQSLVIKNIMYGKVCKNIDLKNYSAKIWIVDPYCFDYTAFIVNSDSKNLASSIIPKIYRCGAKHLQLVHQHISYQEYLFLVSSASRIEFKKVTVEYDNGKVIPVEKLVEFATKLKWINVEFDDNDASISSETVKNLLEIPCFSQLEFVTFENIPETFDINTFFVHMKTCKKTSFHLDFSDSISAAYKKRLEAIVDEIFEAGGRGGYKSPLIVFPGIDEEKRSCMYMFNLGFVRNDP